MGWLRDRFDDQISIGTTAKLPAAVDKWDSIVEYIREKYYNGCCASKLILMASGERRTPLPCSEARITRR